MDMAYAKVRTTIDPVEMAFGYSLRMSVQWYARSDSTILQDPNTALKFDQEYMVTEGTGLIWKVL